MSETIQYNDFAKVDLRVGTIIKVEDFPEAKQPAYKLHIDFGPLGIKSSSAQITMLYKKDDLLNKKVIAVINFPDKQIANFKSQCLVLGAVEGKNVTLLTPEVNSANGSPVT